MAGENAGKDFWSSMDLILNLSSGKSWFFFLGPGAGSLRRKESITCPNKRSYDGTAFFLLPFPTSRL